MLVFAEQQNESAVCIHTSPSSWTSLPALHPTLSVITEPYTELPVSHGRFSLHFTHGSEYVGATLSVCLNLHDNTIRFYCAHKVHVNWRKVTRQQQPSLFWRLYKGLWAKFPEQWSGSCGPLGTVWKSQGACEVGCSWAFPELKAVPVFLRSGLVSRQHCGPSIFILLQWKAIERKKKKRHMVPIVW